VFNCDETFDFQAMGRIFVGLCQVGAWGCFDEFNRLEERMLSAVSQQVQTIQEALKSQQDGKKEGCKYDKFLNLGCLHSVVCVKSGEGFLSLTLREEHRLRVFEDRSAEEDIWTEER
jgi:hypothetical protein